MGRKRKEEIDKPKTKKTRTKKTKSINIIEEKPKIKRNVIIEKDLFDNNNIIPKNDILGDVITIDELDELEL